MTGWTLTVLVVVGIAGTGRAARAEPADPIDATGQGQPTMVLHVINYAALSLGVLDETMARVASVYNVIGVRTVWVDSERRTDQRQDGRLHLTILLLSPDMAEKKISAEGIKDGVLGQAHQPSGRASIFCERIATMPGAPTYFPIPLGDVIAHEVGHLVLGSNSHTPSGIMRAHTSVHTIHLQSFDKMQASTIRTVLMKLAGTAARVDVRLIVDGVTIEPSVVAEAKAEVARIFVAEGIGMAWNGAGEMDAESASHYIERSLVILVRRNSARFPAPDDALGVANGQGPARGRLAMIFFQRVQATAMKYFDYHVSLGRVLGLAIAHEIGHMLLPAGHSNTGLMKAGWGASEFLLAGRGKLMLSAAEGQVIRERLSEDNPHGFK